MAQQPFETSGHPIRKLARTLAGLLITFGLLAAAAMALVFIPLEEEGGTAPAGNRGFYLSALSGRFLAEESAGSVAELEPGNDLVPGPAYLCPPGSIALLRSAIDGFEITLFPGARLRIGEPEEAARFNLESGSASLRSFAESGGEALEVAAGGRGLKIEPSSSLLVAVEGEALRLEVYRGAVTVAGASGGRLDSGTAAMVLPDRIEANPGALLPAPRPLQPRAGRVILKEQEAPIDVTFRWREVEGASRYSVELAGNRLFRNGGGDLVAQRSTAASSLTLAVAREGRYYWRVRALGAGGARSDASEPLPLRVRVADRAKAEIPAAPALTVEQITVQSNLIAIYGQTEPGAHVEIRVEAVGELISGTQRVNVSPDGSFRHQLVVYVRGLVRVVVTAYYQPEKTATVIEEVRVDF